LIPGKQAAVVGMVMIMYVDHVAITVKDMDRAVDFYTKKLGFSVLRKGETPMSNVVFIGNNLAQLELFALKKDGAKEGPPLKDNETGIKHMALHVDDIEGVIEELKKRGVEFTSDIGKVGKRSYVFFNDPDGTRLQLLQG